MVGLVNLPWGECGVPDLVQGWGGALGGAPYSLLRHTTVFVPEQHKSV